jgi:hypothetical protein
MNKENIVNFFNGVRATADKYSPEILTGIGIAGMVTTTVLAVKATPKALRLIEEAEDHGIGITSKDGDPDWRYRKLTKIETLKVAWKPYVPAAITGSLSVACLVGASRVNFKRNAALATAYTLSEKALKDYKDSVVETIGEKKEEKIREKVAQKKADEQPVSKSEVVMVNSGGKILFLEPVSNRYFMSDVESVRKVINDLNYRLTTGTEEYISLSEFYDEIGLSHTSISDEIGWNIYRDGQIIIDMPSAKTDKGEPCLVLDYNVSPRYDYSKLS